MKNLVNFTKSNNELTYAYLNLLLKKELLKELPLPTILEGKKGGNE